MIPEANEMLIEACRQGRQMAQDIRSHKLLAYDETTQFSEAITEQQQNIHAGNQLRSLQAIKAIEESATDLGRTVMEAFGSDPVAIKLTEAGKKQKGVVKEHVRRFSTGKLIENDPMFRATNPRGVLEVVNVLSGNVQIDAFHSQRAGRNGGHFIARVLNVHGEPLIRLEPYKVRFPRIFV